MSLGTLEAVYNGVDTCGMLSQLPARYSCILHQEGQIIVEGKQIGEQ